MVQIDDGNIRAYLNEVIRATVEETLNALLDGETDHLCGARKYERTEGRKDTRAGSYERHLHTEAGDVSLQVPKLRSLPFETAIIERCRRQVGLPRYACPPRRPDHGEVKSLEQLQEGFYGPTGVLTS